MPTGRPVLRALPIEPLRSCRVPEDRREQADELTHPRLVAAAIGTEEPPPPWRRASRGVVRRCSRMQIRHPRRNRHPATAAHCGRLVDDGDVLYSAENGCNFGPRGSAQRTLPSPGTNTAISGCFDPSNVSGKVLTTAAPSRWARTQSPALLKSAIEFSPGFRARMAAGSSGHGSPFHGPNAQDS